MHFLCLFQGLGLGAAIIYLDYVETKKAKRVEKVPDAKLPKFPTPPIAAKPSVEDTKKMEDDKTSKN